MTLTKHDLGKVFLVETEERVFIGRLIMIEKGSPKTDDEEKKLPRYRFHVHGTEVWTQAVFEGEAEITSHYVPPSKSFLKD